VRVIANVMRHIREAAIIPRRTPGHRSRVSDSKKAFAAELRTNPTRAAEILWGVLRGKRLGHKIRRRAVLYGWIPDFWCPASRVAIEIDYPSDRSRIDEHRRRDDVLARRAIIVFRIPAERVYTELGQVVRELVAFLGERPK
jgi:very-short-patch-repair endonuclease